MPRRRARKESKFANVPTPECDHYKQTSFTCFTPKKGHKLWRYSINNTFGNTMSFEAGFLKPSQQPRSTTPLQDEEIEISTVSDEEYDPSQDRGIHEEEALKKLYDPECPEITDQERKVAATKRKRSSNPPIQQTVTTEDDKKPKRQRKQKITSPLMSLADVVQLMMPILFRTAYPVIRQTANRILTHSGGKTPLTKDLQSFWEASRTRSVLMEGLKTIAIAFQQFVSSTETSMHSFQDFVLTMRGDIWSTPHIESRDARTLGEFFEALLRGDETSAPPVSTGSAPSSHSQCTTSAAMSTSTLSTPASGMATSAGAADFNPSGTSASATLDGQNSSDPFLPRHSGALRSITWQRGSMNCTVKWAQNTGEFLIKQEVYRWDDIKTLHSKDWWRHAVHRSQVFGNQDEEHVKLAAQRAGTLKTLWLDDQLRKRHQSVETFGDQRPPPPRQTALDPFSFPAPRSGSSW